MKRSVFLLLLLGALLLLTACDSGGKFRVVNNTSYPLYVQIDDEDEITIPADSEHIFEIDTATQHIFNPDVEKEVPVRMIGETYQIWDEDEEAFTDSTNVTVKVGETLSAYINPNRASFKVVNNSSNSVQGVILYKHNFVGGQFIADLGPLQPGEVKFLPVDYATANNNFYYYATVELNDSSILTFGDQTNIIQIDQQFLITLSDPD